MNLEKIMNEFVDEYMSKGGTYADREEIVNLALEVNKIIGENKDATPEEWIEKLIADSIRKFDETTVKYPIDNYATGFRTLNTNIEVYSNPKMENSLFELNAMEMAIVDGVVFELVKNGELSYSEKVKELDPRFVNIDDDLTVGDVAFYKAKLFTDGNVANEKNPEDALYKLFTMTGSKDDDYRYGDLNPAVLKQVIETVTNRKYVDLAEDYISNVLGLHNLHVRVPENKYSLMVNTPNVKYGKSNDKKSILLDPVNGAGAGGSLFGTSEDIKTLMMNLDKHIPDIMDKEYAYTALPGGVWEDTYVDEVEQIEDTVALHGRFGTEAVGNKRGAYTVLLDTASIPLDKAKAIEEKMNFERAKEDKKPVSIVSNLEFYYNGKAHKYDFVDTRLYLPIADSVTENLLHENAKSLVRIKFLEKVLESYDKEYLQKGIEIKKVGKTK